MGEDFFFSHFLCIFAMLEITTLFEAYQRNGCKSKTNGPHGKWGGSNEPSQERSLPLQLIWVLPKKMAQVR